MSPTCDHLKLIAALPPPKGQPVHREQCTLCFDGQDSPSGVDVCLQCFNGGCLGQDRKHSKLHYEKTGHPYVLNVKRKLKPSLQRGEDDEPPAKMKKLAIVEEKDEDKYEHSFIVRCYNCDSSSGRIIPEALNDPKIQSLKNAIMQSLSSARQSEVKAWEEEILPCEHTFTLFQQPSSPAHIPSKGSHCNKCELNENLWLCLTCGSLGCGRKLFGGLGGNGHGLEHFNETGHAVCVKLGTITPEGNADIYCYLCDDAKLDPELASHLATFGIDVENMSKTEKSMTELQLEHNLKYDFSLLSQTGESLKPLFGQGLTGLQNLGNSCYMASVLQTLFSLKPFQERYQRKNAEKHYSICPYVGFGGRNNTGGGGGGPADCLECQMYKIADGLLSGRYSHPANNSAPAPSSSSSSSPPSPISSLPSSSSPPTTTQTQTQMKKVEELFQEGIRPVGFKNVIGKGHNEFSTMRQQDAEEFLGWLINVFRRERVRRRGVGEDEDDLKDPTTIFSYVQEQRIQCSECKKVRYVKEDSDVVSVSVPAIEKQKPSIPTPESENTATTKEQEKEKEKTLYEDVKLMDCLDMLVKKEALDWVCEGCERKVIGIKQTKFATFPQTLIIHAKKFQLVNWVPSKLDIKVVLPENEVLIFGEEYSGKGLVEGEVELVGRAKPTEPQFNQEILAQMESMGFPTLRCKKALLATGMGDAEVALGWLFEHSDDIDIDEPLPGTSTSQDQGQAQAQKQGPEPPQESIDMLSDMGFTNAQAKKALRETDNNMERAVEWLFSHPDDDGSEPIPISNSTSTSTSAPIDIVTKEKEEYGTKEVPVRYKLKAFISHKGPSVHSGHYVAHIRKGDISGNGEDGNGMWVLFNDEKVVRADKESVDELKGLAYLYVFERV